MKNRAVRIALFLLVVVAFAGAGYELAMLERRAAAMADAARAFEEKARQLEAALGELRAAQFAYVAAGQGPAFWTARGTTLLSAIGGQMQELVRLEKAAVAAGLDPGETESTAAQDELATVQRIDASVQAYVREQQRLLASDILFSDLRQADQALCARVEEARHRMLAAAVAATEHVRKAQIATSGGAALFAVLVLMLLVPGGRDRRGIEPVAVRDAPAQPGAAPATKTQPKHVSAGILSLSLDDVTPRSNIPVQSLPERDGEVGATPAPAEESAAALVHEPIDLAKAATICTDFARLRDTAQIPALLGRVANLLDASGIIIWLDDSTSGELRPALGFGYSPNALARIRAIPREADNLTAQAYRDRTLRVVEEDVLSNGAIAVPLLGPDGCVGVMAAEIRRGGEAHADVQAAATIVAAQLATLVVPPTVPQN